MKRMINGAVSDISHALKPSDLKPGELPSPSMDFIFVPVPQSELLKIHSGSLQVSKFLALLPIPPFFRVLRILKGFSTVHMVLSELLKVHSGQLYLQL